MAYKSCTNCLFTNVKHILYFFTFRSFILMLFGQKQHLTFITELHKTTWQGTAHGEGLVQEMVQWGTQTHRQPIFITLKLKLVCFLPSVFLQVQVLCNRNKAVSKSLFWCLNINYNFCVMMFSCRWGICFRNVDEKSGFLHVIEKAVDFWCKKQQRNGWKHFIKGWKQVLRQRQGNPGQSIRKTESWKKVVRLSVI